MCSHFSNKSKTYAIRAVINNNNNNTYIQYIITYYTLNVRTLAEQQKLLDQYLIKHDYAH